MPDHQTTEAPVPEPLELRLLRDLLDEHATPLRCPRRQCRRSRHCSGQAPRAHLPLASGVSLPPCAAKAKPIVHQELRDMAGQLHPHVSPGIEPRQWPEDAEAAAKLRLALARLHRIHTRPGPHPEHERAALAAWAASDPNPQATALYRCGWHHIKPEKRPSASPGTAA
ncbi:hypothetical protein [Rhizobium wuzhouense]|uniref:hypothetical protein n=1 Tax=Rhizobium wuzhouense TaxID=1986026 RepID=UPI001057EF41|nr:hypothetical protein [Rhizobium wuzhouense]